jgi:hypothetical protein
MVYNYNTMPPDNDNIIPAADRFRQRRIERVAPDIGASALADYLTESPALEFEYLKATFESIVQPIIDILNEGGYDQAAREVSSGSLKILIKGGQSVKTVQAVQMYVEKVLKDTDPDLYAYALKRPPEPEED